MWRKKRHEKRCQKHVRFSLEVEDLHNSEDADQQTLLWILGEEVERGLQKRRRMSESSVNCCFAGCIDIDVALQGIAASSLDAPSAFTMALFCILQVLCNLQDARQQPRCMHAADMTPEIMRFTSLAKAPLEKSEEEKQLRLKVAADCSRQASNLNTPCKHRCSKQVASFRLKLRVKAIKQRLVFAAAAKAASRFLLRGGAEKEEGEGKGESGKGAGEGTGEGAGEGVEEEGGEGKGES